MQSQKRQSTIAPLRPASRAAGERDRPEAAAGVPKVLVIDDDALVRRTICRILEHGGYQVAVAEDGAEGAAKFRSEQPDLVITDIIMPEQEGIETIMAMLRENPRARIVAVSGGGRLGSLDFLTVARKLGAKETLRKPFEPAELLGCVSRALAAA